LNPVAGCFAGTHASEGPARLVGTG
jgi:hypothetical protein